MLALILYISYYLLLFSDHFLKSLLDLSTGLSIIASPSSSSVSYYFGYLGGPSLLFPTYKDPILRRYVVYYLCKLGNKVQHYCL